MKFWTRPFYTVVAAFSVATILPTSVIAEDQRVILPKDYPTEVVQLVQTDQTAFAFSLQSPDPDFAKIFQAGGDAKLSSALDDLNGDGKPEIITELSGLETCGARDCQFLIASPSANGYAVAFDGYASSIALGKRSANGWREIVTNLDISEDGSSGVIWEWRDGRYQIK